MTEIKLATVQIDGLPQMAKFIADVAKAESLFYALTIDEHKSLPVKAKRGMAALQTALRDLRGVDSMNRPVDSVAEMHPIPDVESDQPET